MVKKVGGQEQNTKQSTAKKQSTQKNKTLLNAKNIKTEQPEINIGMIGHVDHGKTSLTKAMTGKWTDTHSEELKRGISIRLGYADATFFKLKTTSGEIYSTNAKDGEVISKRIVSFVDAPGHETLMTTMLSGAALMNGAVLVIAANEDCPQPRTIEHLTALKFAGIKNIVVAQNKVDLVERKDALKNYEKIKTFMKNYGYENAKIIPTVANFGANIDLLIKSIEENIPTPKYDLKKPMKMFIARSFDINKPGTKIENLKGAVIGGSISQGIIKIGDKIQLYPGIRGDLTTEVLSLATDEGLIKEATPGGLIAVGTTLDPSIAQNDTLRGQIAAKPGTMAPPTDTISMKTEIFERKGLENKEKVEIKTNDPLVLTIGTNTAVGIVIKNVNKEVTMKLKNVIVVEKGEKIAVSKNLDNQWRLIAYGEVL
jgi:translation initiation factor 2 subunit 3